MRRIRVQILFIFFLALFLRLFKLGENPTFISDEVSIGYNAYSILKTARDEWGKLLPFSFKCFGEYKLPVYIYLTVPFIATFGLNELATRLPSSLLGAGSIILIYHLLRRLFSKNGKIVNSPFPLLASFFLAISPWHIQTSRMTLEANVSLFIFLLAFYFLLQSFNKKTFSYFALPLFSLSLYTYNGCRVFVPVFLLGFCFLYREELRKEFLKKWFLSLLLALLILLPLIFTGFQETRARLFKVGIFTDPGIISRINQKRGECLNVLPNLICRVSYNRPVVYTKVFIQNYLSHFTQDFLFWQGSNLAQYSIPNRGMLYLFELPLIILGILYLIKEKREFLVLLTWLLAAPIANSFTGLAHPVRAIHLLPLFSIFTAGGVTFALLYLKKSKLMINLFKITLFLVILISGTGFLVNYFVFYPLVHTSTWQGGYPELYSKLVEYEKEYQKIIVSKFYGEPHIFFLFYSEFPPAIYQKGIEVVRYDREDRWVNVDKIGKYYFLEKIDFAEVEPGSLVVAVPKEVPEDWQVVDEVRWQDGEIAFKIVKPYEEK